MKKNIITINAWLILLFICAAASLQSCKKDIRPGANDLKFKAASMHTLSATSDSALIAYKNSPHEIMAGFYRTWRDRTVSGNANDPIMTDLPDSLDVAIVFPNYTPASSSYWTQLKNVYIPYLHARGTKVIITGGIGLAPGAGSNAAGYAATAKLIMDSTINKYGLDGYDIDIESNPSGQTLTDEAGVYNALSAYLGPKSGTGKILTFDTNQDGTNALFRQVYTDISYLWLQAYGRGASTLQSTWNTFSPYISSNQFVTGFSFYEENGYPSNYWDDVIYPENGTGRAYDYARWEPATGKKGGVFGYAIDRDAPLTSQHDNTIIHPDFRVTNDLIRIMNPPNIGIGATNAVSLSSGSINGGNVTQLNGASKFTLEAWVKFNSTGSWSNILAKSTSSTNRIALQTGAGNGSLYAIVDNGSNTYGYTGANVVTTGQWYHVAMVFDGTQSSNANRLKLYVNGVQQTLTFSGTIPASVNTSNTAAFLAGKETTSSTNTYLAGSIDEIRVWNQALTQATISAWENKTLGSCHPNYSGLVLYWPLDSPVNPAVAGLATTYTGAITNGTYMASTQASSPSGCQ